MNGFRRSALLAGVAALVLGCSDDGTEPEAGEASIVGRIEEEVPPGEPAGTAAPAAAAQTAQTVIVAEVQADGSLAQVAEGTVEVDGSFAVAGVPAGRENLVVVAHDESMASVGSVLVHARTTADATIEVAPIDISTTLEARAFSEVRAGGGSASSGEVTLLVHAPAGAGAGVVAATEVEAAAAGVIVAGETLTGVFAETGTELDAAARAEPFTAAAIEFAASRYGGTAVGAAEDALLDASLDALVDAGVSLEAIVQATAAAATTMDAELQGQTSARGHHVMETVRLNLRARQRLALQFADSTEGPVANNAAGVLATVENGVLAATTAAEIRTALEAGLTASLGTTLQAVVSLLVPGTDLPLQAEVEGLAVDAAVAARLSTRLEAAVTAQEAVAAVESYQAEVRAAVQAMVEASGNTEVDVDALTSLFIASYGGAEIH